MIKIRYGLKSDLPLAYEAYKAVTPAENKEESAKGFVRWLATSDSTKKLVLVAEVDTEEAGMVVVSIGLHPYEYPPEFGFVDVIYVKKKFRDSGVAHELISKGRDWLQQNRVPIVYGIHKLANDKFWDLVSETFPGIKKVASMYQEKFIY